MKLLHIQLSALVQSLRGKRYRRHSRIQVFLSLVFSAMLAVGVWSGTGIASVAQTDADAAISTPENVQPSEAAASSAAPVDADSESVNAPSHLATETTNLGSVGSEADAAENRTAEIATSPVDIQGRRLFRVATAGGISAQRRASEISQKLQQLELQTIVPTVEIRQDEGVPTLWLQSGDADALYLMTVTENDAVPGTPTDTAEAWAEALRIGLQDTHRELTQGNSGRLLSVLGIVAVALAAQFILLRLWRWLQLRLMQMMASSSESNPESNEESSHKLFRLSSKILLLLLLGWLWGSAALTTANLFPLTRQLSNTLQDNIVNTLTLPLIPVGDGYSLVSFVLLAIVLVGLVIASGAVTDFLRSRFLTALGVSTGIQEAIAVVFKYCFITLGVVIALQLWGIDLGSLAIFASALSVGIGFGLQDIAKNLGSGLVLVFERPIQVGDFVEVGGYIGTIEKLSARSTRIRTMDDLTVFVPNSRFLEEEVTNWSHKRSPSRIRIPVGVAYGSNLEVVTEALLEAASEHKSIAKAPKPQVFFMGFGDSSLDFVLLVWISRPQLHVRVKSELNYRIDAAFRQRNIEIPFPQRDLNIRSGDLPILMNYQENDQSADDRYYPNSDRSSNGNHHQPKTLQR